MKRVCCVLVLAAFAPLVNAQVLTEDPSKRRVIPESMALQSHQTEHWMRSIPVHSNVTAQMRSLGINLRKFIVPPAGTLREEVEAVFGKPFTNDWVRLEDGSRPGTIAQFELLPRNIDRREGVVLRLYFRGGKTVGDDVELQDWCARSGKVAWFPGEAEEETRKVLVDLLLIYGEYREKLERTTWNVPKKEDPPTKQATRTKE
jgi:hypothetical protein